MVGAVRVAVLGRPHQVGEPELPAVDDGVVAVGEDVAVETRRQGVVGDDLGCSPAALCGLLLPHRHAEHMVDVAVRVDGGVEPVCVPGPDVVVHHLGQRGAAGVDEDEAVTGGERGDVGERRTEADAVGDLDESPDVIDGVEGGGGELAVPEPVGEVEDVSGHWSRGLRRDAARPGRVPLGGRLRGDVRSGRGRRQLPEDFSSAGCGAVGGR